MAAPTKQDRIEVLTAELEILQAKNSALLACVRIRKARIDSLTDIVVNKVKEVEDKVVKEVSEVAHTMNTKVQKCIDVAFYERKQQEKDALKVQIGGLPQLRNSNSSPLRN